MAGAAMVAFGVAILPAMLTPGVSLTQVAPVLAAAAGRRCGRCSTC